MLIDEGMAQRRGKLLQEAHEAENVRGRTNFEPIVGGAKGCSHDFGKSPYGHFLPEVFCESASQIAKELAPGKWICWRLDIAVARSPKTTSLFTHSFRVGRRFLPLV